MVKRDRLIAAMDGYLETERFDDYAPQGLQVEGAEEVKRITTGVSLSLELIRHAAESGSQMLLVHHGLFWKNASPVLKGSHKARVAALLENRLTLAAYHLPLDAHAVVGNAAQIAKMLGARREAGFGKVMGNAIGCVAAFSRAKPLEAIVERLSLLSPEGVVLAPGAAKIRRFAVVSGGMGSAFYEAIEAGVDLFITGEPWEPAPALAEETGVGFLALGHYNSEKPGILALGGWLKKRFQVALEFADIPNRM